MEKTINILEGTEARIEGFKVFIKGKNGNLERDFFSPLFKNDISLERSDNTIKVSTKATKKKIKAEVGTIAAHIKNMLKGVTDGYTYKLKIIYMHFPITVKVSSKDILISNFLGEKQPRRADIVDGCKVELAGDEIIVTGSSKESVGQTAGNIERATWIKNRDRRVFSDGIYVTDRSG